MPRAQSTNPAAQCPWSQSSPSRQRRPGPPGSPRASAPLISKAFPRPQEAPTLVAGGGPRRECSRGNLGVGLDLGEHKKRGRLGRAGRENCERLRALGRAGPPPPHAPMSSQQKHSSRAELWGGESTGGGVSKLVPEGAETTLSEAAQHSRWEWEAPFPARAGVSVEGPPQGTGARGR